MAEVHTYYWDACIWISLIQKEAGRFDSCNFVLALAKRGDVQIWTSAFTFAEVFKRNCGAGKVGLAESEDEPFEDFLMSDYISLAQVDVDVGKLARRLLRKFPTIGKPQDAVHVATACINNLDELHTFDRDDLLKLDGKIPREDGKMLKICKPPSGAPLWDAADKKEDDSSGDEDDAAAAG